MSETVFGIKIDDGSEILSDYALKKNTDTLELWDWQTRAINFFFNHNKSIFEVTTGAGKTFCAIEIAKELIREHPDIYILIVVPKNVILERTWYKELYDNGISLKDIGIFYGLGKEYAKITLTNMQNLTKVALEMFDFCIFDEVHNYGTKRMLEYVGHNFKYKLGLSATVARMDKAHYDILEKFDYNIFKYTPHQALKDGVLNPFDFTDVGVIMDPDTKFRYDEITRDINLILKSGGGFNRIMKSDKPLKFSMLSKMTERKQIVNNYIIKFDIVKMICSKHKNDKIIIFNQFNEQTNKCYWYLLEIGVKARIVHSGISHDKREKNLTDFKKDEYNVLLTTKVLDEGYNLPKIDTAIIMAGDSTSKQTIQRLGRVLRKKDKASTLYQVYCVDTIEEDYARERSSLFKELCSTYQSFIYRNGELV